MALFQLDTATATVPALRPLILVAISLVIALIWHRLVPGFWRATLRATFTSAALFYLIALSGLLNLGPFMFDVRYFFLAETLHTDFLTAFWVAVVVSTLLTSFVITVLVGWGMRFRGRHRAGGGNGSQDR